MEERIVVGPRFTLLGNFDIVAGGVSQRPARGLPQQPRQGGVDRDGGPRCTSLHDGELSSIQLLNRGDSLGWWGLRGGS